MARLTFTFSLILLAALSRLIPHPPNVAPITALALFGGVYLDRKHTFVVPLAAMLVSDYFIGFHSGMLWVYGSFVAIGFVGLWLREHQGYMATFVASVVGSVLFFIVTNFAVWMSSNVMYPPTPAGLIECYVAGIPFFRNTLLGDLFYVGSLFGISELAKKLLPSFNEQRNPS